MHSSREMKPANSVHVISNIEVNAGLRTSVSFEIDNKSQVERWYSN